MMLDLTNVKTFKMTRVSAPPQRDEYMDGRTYRFSLNGQQNAYYVTINAIDGAPKEIFINTSNAQEESESLAATARNMSIALRSGLSVEQVINGYLSTLNPQLAQKIKEWLTGGDVNREVCKKCGGVLVKNSGCNECLSCGEQKCDL